MSESAGARHNPLGLPLDAPAAMHNAPPPPVNPPVPAIPRAHTNDLHQEVPPPTVDLIASFITRAAISIVPRSLHHTVQVAIECMDAIALDFLEYARTQIFRDSTSGTTNLPTPEQWKLYIE